MRLFTMAFVEKANTLYHVGISGGKDSVAALLYLIFIAKIDPLKINATFCDTKNEHEWTYAHIKLVSQKVHPIQWLNSEGFVPLARRKRRFPSTKVRFCTQFLKIFPSRDHIVSLQEKGYDVVAVSGVRADESEERKDLPEWDISGLSGALMATQWRPLIRWTIQQVVDLHAYCNIPMNPLYALGARRVGCFPCIMSRKAEIRMIALRFPERIDEIRAQEQQFEKDFGRYSSFFPSKTVPERFRSKPYVMKNGRTVMVATIDDVVRWSMTGKGARGSYTDQNPVLLDQATPESAVKETLCNSGFCE